MHGINVSPIPRVVDQGNRNARLNWLLAANASEERRRHLFRGACDEEQMLLMKHAISAEKAYALLGLMLGAFPTAVIFGKLLGYGLGPGLMNLAETDGAIFFVCAWMNAVCSLVGYAMGTTISRPALHAERNSWSRMLLMLTFLGSAWGAVAGLAGGFFFFGIGGFIGVAFGIPVGLIGFLLFAIVHRLLERGGMIEMRHFLPLAFGITAVLAAFIASV